MARKKRQDVHHGVIVVDKPSGIRSTAALNAVKKLGGFAKAGHCGTLDPMASGVFVVVAGKATRLAEYFLHGDKEYVADATLGATSDTCDAEGQITPVADPPSKPSRGVVLNALESFIGTTMQVPPAYSAAHVNGKRAYDLARKGEDVKLAARAVTVHSVTLMDYEFPRVTFCVKCGGGFYVRSLARDLGEKLGHGAYLSALRRRSVGAFSLGDALPLDDFTAENVIEGLISMKDVMARGFEVVELNPDQIRALGCTNRLEAEGVYGNGEIIAGVVGGALAAVFKYDGPSRMLVLEKRIGEEA